jgi:hypothetical protein
MKFKLISDLLLTLHLWATVVLGKQIRISYLYFILTYIAVCQNFAAELW